MDVPEASAAPRLVMEPVIAMVTSPSMGRGQGTGAACVLTVDASMETMNLEAPKGSRPPKGYCGGTDRRRLGGRAAPDCVNHHFLLSERTVHITHVN